MKTALPTHTGTPPESIKSLMKLLRPSGEDAAGVPGRIACNCIRPARGEVFIMRSGDDFRWHLVSRTAPHHWRGKICLLLIPPDYANETIKDIVRSWEPYLSPDAKLVIQHNENGLSSSVIDDLTGSLGDYSLENKSDDTSVLRLDRCIHHWLINRDNTGICKHCGRFRDFGKVMKEAELYNPRRRMSATLKKRSAEERMARE